MAFEVVNPECIPVENGTQDYSKGNGLSEPIKFGSHGPKEAVDGAKAHLPKDAVDEWPAAQQVRSFYFVKYRPYDDPKIKAKLDAAEKDARNKMDARFQIIEKIQALRGKRFEISAKISPLSEENQKFNVMLEGKKREMEPLNEVLSQLRPNNSRERGVAICSSEAELNKQIKSLQNRIQHESIPLTEEKQIIREIKQLEATRPQVVAIAQRRAEIEESSESKADLKDQYKLMGNDFSEVKKEKKLITTKLTQLLDQRKAIDEEIEKLDVEVKAATEKRDKAKEVVSEVRKMRDVGNECFYLNKMLLIKAKNIARDTRDVAAVKDMSNSELEKFMKMWNESKPFRDDYEKRILVSLDNRQLSRDGRMRNPNEKPLVVLEPSIPAKPEPVTALKPKQTKKETVSENSVEPTEKSQKENKSKDVKEVKSKELEAVESDDKEKSVEAEKVKKVEKKIDEAKLKEMRREGELAKAKQAAERKKKLAEKAAAKAAIKAQKEAEKKEKDREKKKLKKKGLIPEAEEQPTEAEVVEPGKPEEAVEEPAIVSKKSKSRKTSIMKNMKQINGADSSIQKAILKRKKSTNYWVWAAPAAVAVMMAFVIGYKYLI